MNLWKALPQPLRILAPMEDVTDTVFRQILAELGRPDIFFTEFFRADLLHPRYEKRMQQRLSFTSLERPIIAQIWGNNPAEYTVAAARLAALGYDGIDLNMGCPAAKLVKKGCCAGLIRTPALAAELYHAALAGAGRLPVSIKTRIGLDLPETEDWIGFLLELRPAAVTVHGRTAAEMSEPPADWGQIALAVKLARRVSPDTVVIGNGDVTSLAGIASVVQQSGVDGVMIGRGVFENLTLFRGELWRNAPRVTRIETYIHHVQLHKQHYHGARNFEVLKKFARPYLHGLPDFEQLYSAVMRYHDHDALCHYLQTARSTVQAREPEVS